MPARTCSAIRAEVKKPSANTTSTKPGTCWNGGNIVGTTKYQRKICTSSGMLRNSSTQTLARRTSHGLFGSVRKVPISAPSDTATTQEQPATDSVQPQASIIH